MALSTDVLEDAVAHARDAARAAGCTIVPARALDELRTAGRLFDAVWGRSDGRPVVPHELLRALAHAGAPVAVAEVDGRPIGAIVAFLGRHDGAATHLHSHALGLLPEARGRGIGRALKLDQRAWALAHGIDLVEWTFDPLVRANGYFNLARLGAEGSAYLIDFYGHMDDAINAGEPTDRLLVRWELRSPRVVEASSGRAVEPDVAALRSAGAVVLLEVGRDGAPHPRASAPPSARTPALCQVPADIVALRSSAPELARSWRAAVRDTMAGAFAAGYRAVGATRDGWYLLEPAAPPHPGGDR